MNALDVKAEDVKGWADERLAKQRLPLPKKPHGVEAEFDYPLDPNELTSIEVGQWLARLHGYFCYTVRLLGAVESELVAVDAEYKLRINTGRKDVLDNLPARPAAEVVEAEVLARDDSLTPLYERRLRLLAVKAQLEARARIYEKGGQGISRELSRRELEARVIPS